MLNEALERCEPMLLVNIKAKVIDVSETQLVSQKQLNMAYCVISDGEATAKLVLWEIEFACPGLSRLSGKSGKSPHRSQTHKQKVGT